MSKRPKLSAGQERRLWMRSGGLCAHPDCSEWLVFEDIDKTPVNVADKAHIIGHSEKGPRGDREAADIPEEDIHSDRNIILLCKKHHKIVDGNKKRYPPEVLREWKEDHERWVEQRLSCVEASIALVHKTHGPPFDCMTVVDGLDLKLLERAVYQEDLSESANIDWAAAKEENEELVKLVRKQMRAEGWTRVDVFSLSQIPLLVHLGYRITDTVPVRTFQYDRKSGNWTYQRRDTDQPSDLGLTTHFNSLGSSILAIAISVSAWIHEDDIHPVLAPNSYDLFRVSVKEPKIDCVLYEDEVQTVQQRFKREVEALVQHHRYTDIHLLFAGPAGLAVELGRSINKNMWPIVHLYHFQYRESPRYTPAFSI